MTEAGSYTTNYAYDALDDLLSVTQGAQTRTFTYDSLARLTSASNPRVGTTHYCFSTTSPCVTPDPGATLCSGDPSSPCTRTDARSITTTYAYNDVLNRLTAKSYNDTPQTPTANFAYDEATVTLGGWTSPSISYPNGRLTHTTTMSGSTLLTGTAQDYDTMGRIADYRQCPPWFCSNSNPLDTQYAYNFDGTVKQWVHPANDEETLTLYNTVSEARQITAIAASANVVDIPSSVVSNITYTPWGALAGLSDGCTGSGCKNIQETYAYNNRLQPVNIQVGTFANTSANYCLVYNYYKSMSNPTACTTDPTSGTGNNGNVWGMWYQDNANSSYSYSAAFGYDSVNRLSSAIATGNSTYNLSYNYTGDGSTGQFGNVRCTSSGYPFATCPNYTYNVANNQITNTGFTYDAAGDTLSDSTFQYQWDAEGRMSKSLQSSTVEHAYTYNASGQRVQDIPNGQTTQELFYDPSGKFLASYFHYPPQPGWWYIAVPSLGRTLVQAEDWYVGQAWYLHHNALGSLVQMTTQTGANEEDIQLYPWGQTWQYTGPMWPGIYAGLMSYLCQVQPCPDQSETRDYPSNFQRWMTPDPGNAGAEPSDPQTWNMYAYVRNNPTTNVNPLGLTCEAIVDSNGATTGYKDVDGPGGTCADAYQGNIQEADNPSTTVTAQAPPSPELLAVAQGAQQAGPVVNGLAVATGAVTGLAMLPAAVGGTGVTSLTLPGSLGEMITGLYSGVTRQALLAAARIVGPTVTVITNLTRDPSELQALSTATGEGAEALAAAARSGPGVQTFTAEVPKALMVLLERAGLAFPSITSMGTATAQEWYFNSQAMEFVAKYFK